MSLYETVLGELTLVEGKSLTILEKNKCQQLRHKLMFILPLSNTRLRGYWKGAQTTQKELYQLQSEIRPDCLDYFKICDNFVDYWLAEVSCSMSSHFCNSRNWPSCLWHYTLDFYSCSPMEEGYECIVSSAMPRRPESKQQEDYDWIRFTEAVLVNLDYVHSEPVLLYLDHGTGFLSLSDVIKGQIRAISEGLGVIRSFRKSMAKWNSEGVEYVKVEILDFYWSIENLPHNVTHIFARYFLFDGNMSEDEFSTLVNMVNVALFQAKDIYLQVLQALKLNHEGYRIINM